MQFIPEWAPNIHPLIIHFPIVLLLTAAVVDLIALARMPHKGLHLTSVCFYAVGALSAIVTYFTGRIAADSVMLSSTENTLVTDHSDLALITTIFFSVYALVRLVVWHHLRAREVSQGLFTALVLVGLAGYGLVQQTAERGARLVYEQGVGVRTEGSSMSLDLSGVLSSNERRETGPQVVDGGGWIWLPSTPVAWKNDFSWTDGVSSDLESSIVVRDSTGSSLALSPSDSPITFVFPNGPASVQIDAQIDLQQYSGSFRIVHNYQDPENYRFFEIEGGVVRQGAVKDGDESILDRDKISLGRDVFIRVVGDKTHVRAYVSGALTTHGHGDDWPAGAVGFRLDGRGTVYLDGVTVENLRPEEDEDEHDPLKTGDSAAHLENAEDDHEEVAHDGGDYSQDSGQ